MGIVGRIDLQKLGMKNLVSLIVVGTVFLVAANPAFADRSITFEKVVDIDKNTLQESLTDLNSLPKIFPKNVKSVESQTTDEKNSAKVTFGLNGLSINSEIEVTELQNRNILEIVSGDLKGTRLTTVLQETWGFDGTPNQGTVVKMKMILQTSGLLSLVGLASDDDINYSLDKSLIDIVSYVKSSEKVSKQDNENSDDSKEEPKQKTTKRKRR